MRDTTTELVPVGDELRDGFEFVMEVETEF